MDRSFSDDLRLKIYDLGVANWVLGGGQIIPNYC